VPRYDWVRKSSDEDAKKAAEQLRQCIFWGRPDGRIADQFPKLQKDVDGLLEQVKKANKDHGVVTAALLEIDLLSGCSPEQHGLTLGKVAQIAIEARRKITDC